MNLVPRFSLLTLVSLRLSLAPWGRVGENPGNEVKVHVDFSFKFSLSVFRMRLSRSFRSLNLFLAIAAIVSKLNQKSPLISRHSVDPGEMTTILSMNCTLLRVIF